MIRRPPRSTRTDTLFTYTTLFRSPVFSRGSPGAGGLRLAAPSTAALWGRYSTRKTTKERHSMDDARDRPGPEVAAVPPLDHETCFELADRILPGGGLGGYSLPGNLRFAIRRGESSEGRRVGKAGVRTCRARWSPYH